MPRTPGPSSCPTGAIPRPARCPRPWSARATISTPGRRSRRAHPAGATATATGTTSRSTRCSPPTRPAGASARWTTRRPTPRRDVQLRRARRRGGGPAQRLRPRPEHRVRARVVRGGRGRGARRRRSSPPPGAPPQPGGRVRQRRLRLRPARLCLRPRPPDRGRLGCGLRHPRRGRLHARPGGHDGRGRRHPHGLRLRVLQRGPPRPASNRPPCSATSPSCWRRSPCTGRGPTPTRS